MSGYVGLGKNHAEQVFREDFEDEFTDEMRAAAFTQLIAKSKEAHPEVFDEASELFRKRVEMQEEIEGGSVTIAGHTLHSRHGVAPQIWETSEVDQEGIIEVYVRVRHDHASGRVVDSSGEIHTIYTAETLAWHESDAEKAQFFMKLNDKLIGWQA